MSAEAEVISLQLRKFRLQRHFFQTHHWVCDTLMTIETPFTLATLELSRSTPGATRVTQKCVCKRLSYPEVLPGMTQLDHSQD